ncbi:hypothetical protein Ctob_011069 [Chrysochromulina tobinii]|uniref:Uncharacterized protein n=1 Tax=Chrysochromulina tobinii TaxID=1460289 RepID=A0A0M0JY62_9EUKA|nr:hypothetical protein Ctob_011069 [Chrysochromulina tobinii]|eukprot:KOO31499.1 hypothetical protein Ctob_011069 [Chrysochromulina sp. CCMP291]
MREREQALLSRLDHNDQAIAAVLAEHARKVDMPGLEALLALKADKKSADQRLRDAARQLAELREQVFARCESLQQAMQQAMQEMQLLDSRLNGAHDGPSLAPTVTSAAMGFGGEHEEVRVNAAEVAAAQRRLEEHLEARS